MRQKGPKNATKLQITTPIRAGDSVKLGYGARVEASELLGKPVPYAFKDTYGRSVRLREATLAQYLTNQPRVATPVRFLNSLVH